MDIPIYYKSLINILLNSIKDIKINKLDVDIDLTFKDKSTMKITNKEINTLLEPILKEFK